MNESELEQEQENLEVSSKILPPRRARRTPEPFSPPKTVEKEGEASEGNEEKPLAPQETTTYEIEDITAVFQEDRAEDAAAEDAVAECSKVPAEAENAVKDGDALWDTPKETKEPPTQAEKSKAENTLSGPAGIFDWIKSFLFSLTVVVFVFTLVFRGVTVDGNSMLPTLQDKEYLIISDLFYTPKTGDIVVVQSPHYKNGTEPIIKRVIATGGQEVQINFNSWEIFVDGEKLEEDYILRMYGVQMNPEDMNPNENGVATVVVEENCVFVMGDNRNDSMDSRDDNVGQIDTRYIMGRVILRAAPVSRFGKVD